MVRWKISDSERHRNTKSGQRVILLGDKSGGHTEEEVLQDDRLSGEVPKGGGAVRRYNGGRLLLNARPGQVDVEEKEEDAKADDRRLSIIDNQF